MKKLLVLAVCFFALTGANANAWTYHRGGPAQYYIGDGANRWAARNDWGLHCAEYRNDPRCGGYGGQSMVRVAPQYSYGWYVNRERRIIVVLQPPFRGDWTVPARVQCLRELSPNAWNMYTQRWERRFGVGENEDRGIQGLWYENAWYEAGHVRLANGCYVTIDAARYRSLVFPNLYSGDPDLRYRAYQEIEAAARAQGIPVDGEGD